MFDVNVKAIFFPILKLCFFFINGKYFVFFLNIYFLLAIVDIRIKSYKYQEATVQKGLKKKWWEFDLWNINRKAMNQNDNIFVVE